MIKYVIAVFMVLFLSFVSLAPLSKTYAETPQVINQINETEEDSKDERVKEKLEYEGRILKEKERFPVSHYELETYFPKDFSSFITLGYSQSGQQAVKGIADMLWFTNKSLGQFFIFSVSEMMSYDFLSKVAEPVGGTLERISGVNSENGVFSSFLTLIVAIMAGCLVVIYYGKNNASGAVQALISSVIILVGCYWFYGDATKHLQYVNSISSEIESTISGWTVNFSSEVDKTSSQPYTAKESQALLENQLFNLMIKKPYLNMMYGTSDEAEITKDNKDRITKLLELKTSDVESKETRNKIVNEEVQQNKNDNMNILTLPQRVGYSILYLIATIFLGIPFMILAASKITLQVIFIVMLLISPALFLISLIPNFQDTAGITIKKLIGLIVAKAGIVFLVTISIGITTLLYETTQVSSGFTGHAFLVFMDCLFIFSIFKYKKEIFTITSSARFYAENAVDRVTKLTGSSAEQAKELGKKGFGFAVDRVRQSNARQRGSNDQAGASQQQGENTRTNRTAGNGTVRTSGTVSGNTNAAKQSSKRQKQVTPESVSQSEAKQDVLIPLPQKEPQQEVKQQTFILITQTISHTPYRESPARRDPRVASKQKHTDSEQNEKANDPE